MLHIGAHKKEKPPRIMEAITRKKYLTVFSHNFGYQKEGKSYAISFYLFFAKNVACFADTFYAGATIIESVTWTPFLQKHHNETKFINKPAVVAELVRESISRRSNLYSKVEGSNPANSRVLFWARKLLAKERNNSVRELIQLDLRNDVMRAQHDVMGSVTSNLSRWTPNLLFVEK